MTAAAAPRRYDGQMVLAVFALIMIVLLLSVVFGGVEVPLLIGRR